MSPQSQPWRPTPLLQSTSLTTASGPKIHLKLENLQPSGSFKSRGVGNYMLTHLSKHQSAPTTPHFYSSSGGNAGLAAVLAARALNLPCTVVVPLSTQPFMIAKIRDAGAADVIQVGSSWREADAHLRDEILHKNPHGVYVPPFDHPDIWAGNATLVRELQRQWLESDPARKPPAAVVCAVGGGGLLCGIMQGLHSLGTAWGDVPVVALETLGADSLHQSVGADALVTLPGITSAAKCLGATRVAEKAFEWATGRAAEQVRRRAEQVDAPEAESLTNGDQGMARQKGKTQVISAALSDAEAAMGCWRLAEGERLLVEMACGVVVAACFGGRLEGILGRKLGEDEEVVVVVCGGSDVTAESIVELKKRYGSEVDQ